MALRVLTAGPERPLAGDVPPPGSSQMSCRSRVAGKLFELSGPIRVVSDETGLEWSPWRTSRDSAVTKPGARKRVNLAVAGLPHALERRSLRHRSSGFRAGRSDLARIRSWTDIAFLCVIPGIYQMLLGLTPPWRPAAGGTEQ